MKSNNEIQKVEHNTPIENRRLLPMWLFRILTAIARVAPISGSVIGGMLTSKCAITQVANRTYILTGSLFAFSGHRNLNLICQKRVGCDNSPLPKAAIHYWRNHIGIGGRQCIGIGGCFKSECLAVFGRNTQIDQ